MTLESFTGRALRDLPARRAPGSLQERVFAELERRAALPWWRKSFMHWPIVARAAFLVASYFFVKFVLSGLAWLLTAVRPAATEVQDTVDVLSTLSNVGVRLFQIVPPQWVYGGVLFGAAVYLAFFALGATAYRILYAPSRNTGASDA